MSATVPAPVLVSQGKAEESDTGVARLHAPTADPREAEQEDTTFSLSLLG